MTASVLAIDCSDVVMGTLKEPGRGEIGREVKESSIAVI